LSLKEILASRLHLKFPVRIFALAANSCPQNFNSPMFPLNDVKPDSWGTARLYRRLVVFLE
jgi:hypothetical protein